MSIRYISDCHFGHANIIRYDNRPFRDVDEMERDMIRFWNRVVAEADTVYCLGDFCWKQNVEDWMNILGQLNGHIFIIKGNHDRTNILKALEKKGFIVGWSHQVVVKDGENRVVLNHSPMPFFINQYKDNWYHLYGHVHTSYDWNMAMNLQRSVMDLYQKPIRMYNVGCMVPYMMYEPKTLAEIESGFNKLDPLNIDFSIRNAYPKKEKSDEELRSETDTIQAGPGIHS